MTATACALVQSACWICGNVLTRQVSPAEAARREFGWGCVPCGVSWVGPGELAGPAR
jgi:hypothetical protein